MEDALRRLDLSSNNTDPRTAIPFKIFTASFAMLSCVVILLLSALGAIFPWWSKLLSMPVTYVLFLMGTLLVTVNLLTNKDDSHIEEYFRIASTSLAGIFYVIVGAVVFFQKPSSCSESCQSLAGNRQCVQHEQENMRTLAHHHPSMGLVVGTITLFLAATETFLVAGYFEAVRTIQSNKDLCAISSWLGFVRVSICLLQKIVQVAVYILLRRRIATSRFGESASFYFKVLSCYNLVSWLHDIVDLDDVLMQFSETGSSAEAFAGSAIKLIYKALLIDYRLLCSLLFLEHAVEIQETPTSGAEIDPATHYHTRFPNSTGVIEEVISSDQYGTIDDMTSSDRHKSNLGYLVGLSCLLVQLVRLSNYVREFRTGPWVHVFAIAVYALLSVCGMILLKANKLEIRHKSDTESAGIKIMVCCMGAVGSTCWIVQAALVGFWAARGLQGDVRDHDYFCWAAAVLSVKAVGTLFLVIVFAKVNVAVITKRNPTVKVNHFLVPAMMLGILSEFVGTVIDQDAGSIRKQISHQVIELSLKLLFEAGSAMYLGFCIHLSLYFFVVQRHLGKTRVPLDNTRAQPTEDSPLLGSLRPRKKTRKPTRTV